MKRARPSQQGELDGLCGVYSLLHFLRDQPFFRQAANHESPSAETRGREAFWYLLQAMEQEQLLKAHYLWNGLEWFQLKRIFDRVCNELRVPYRAIALEAVAQHLKSANFFEIAEAISDNGGAAVVHDERREHWMLMHKVRDGKVYLDDSAQTGDVAKGLGSAACSRFSISEGLALLPLQSTLAELN